VRIQWLAGCHETNSKSTRDHDRTYGQRTGDPRDHRRNPRGIDTRSEPDAPGSTDRSRSDASSADATTRDDAPCHEPTRDVTTRDVPTRHESPGHEPTGDADEPRCGRPAASDHNGCCPEHDVDYARAVHRTGVPLELERVE
jgi:hypothetical protein